MFNRTKELKEEVKNLSEKVTKAELCIAEMSKIMSGMNEKIKAFDNMFEDYESLSIEKALAKKSDQPWAGFSVSDISKDGRVALKLDWNDEFVDYLKRNGIDGGSEEDTVGVWFASLMKEMGQEVDENQAEEIRKTHRIQ